jgi:hypothetical protein
MSRHQKDLGVGPFEPDVLLKFRAGHAWHPYVGNHEINRAGVPSGKFQRLLAVHGWNDRISSLGEDCFEKISQLWLVFRQQHDTSGLHSDCFNRHFGQTLSSAVFSINHALPLTAILEVALFLGDLRPVFQEHK